jgi:ribonuclease VapC
VILVADASAIVAVAFWEPERVPFADLLAAADEVYMTSINIVEAALAIVVRRGLLRGEAYLGWLAGLRVKQAEVDAADALRAYEQFGKGRHPARLNLGDCYAYALARSLDAPLLYKGADFALTDIRAALQPT